MSRHEETELRKKQLLTDIRLLMMQLDPLLHSTFYRIWKTIGWLVRAPAPQIPKQNIDHASEAELLEHRDKLEKTLAAVHTSWVFRMRMLLKTRENSRENLARVGYYNTYTGAWNVLTRQEIEGIVRARAQKIIRKSHQHVMLLESETPIFSILILHHTGTEMTKRCVESILKTVGAIPVEIHILNNGTQEPVSGGLFSACSRVIKIKISNSRENLSFSSGNNLLASKASGRFLLFLNNDTEAMDGWLHALYLELQQFSKSILGGKLIYPQGQRARVSRDITFPQLTIQHQGIAFGRKQTATGVFSYLPENIRKGDHPFSVSADTPRATAAVSGACLCLAREIFSAIGGFDEEYFYGYEDVDLCLRAWQQGFQVRYVPSCTLFHYEFGTQDTITDAFRKDSMRRRNELRFLEKWQRAVEESILLDRIRGNQVWNDQKLRIGVSDGLETDRIVQIRELVTRMPYEVTAPPDDTCDIVWESSTPLLSIIQQRAHAIEALDNHLLPRS